MLSLHKPISSPIQQFKRSRHTSYMAVQSPHFNLFFPQNLTNKGVMMSGVEGIGNAPAAYGLWPPLSGTKTATAPGSMVPMYSSAITETVLAKMPAIKSDSGLTYSAVPVSRKRSRDVPSGVHLPTANNRRGPFTFLGEDFSFQLHQQQLEIDRFISQHTDKMRLEVEERRKIYLRRIAAAVEENMIQKLRAKEEEMGKMKCALEEQVKSLCVENQIWRDLAQANEATANALRCNLEQVLAQQVQDKEQASDDAQSSCGHNYEETTLPAVKRRDHDGKSNSNRMCRSCGKEESRVLLLPCRHLCLCSVCGSSLHTCPVCNSLKTATFHVNLSVS